MKVRVLLAEDHPVIRRILRQLIEADHRCEVCAEAEDGLAAVQLYAQCAPDVIVLDIQMPKLDGLQAAAQIRKVCPLAAIVIVTMHTAPQLAETAAAAGARAFVRKSDAAAHLVPAILAAASGASYSIGAVIC